MFLFHSSGFFSAGENFYKNLDIVDRIKALADKKGVTPGQLSIAWVAAQGTIPIPGTKQVGRLEENWGARDVDLNAEELAEMRAVIDAAKPVGNRCAVVCWQILGVLTRRLGITRPPRRLLDINARPMLAFGPPTSESK